MKAILPSLLVASRVLLCPLIVFGARVRWAGIVLAGMVVLALLSDIYDGVLARKWGVETSKLRVSDSLADTVFYIGAAVALWLVQPEIFRNNSVWFIALFALEALRYIFDLAKYKKTASYHSYLAKFWGLLLAVVMVGVFALRGGTLLVRIALAVGILVNLEGLAMSLLLPVWKNDVKTLFRALQFRREMLTEKPSPADRL